MMGTLITFPRLRDTYPEDLLWAAPGTPATRRLSDADPVDVTPPEQWRAKPIGGDWLERGIFLSLYAVVFLVGLIVGELLAMAQIMGGRLTASFQNSPNP
jgi:hypothetical protein